MQAVQTLIDACLFEDAASLLLAALDSGEASPEFRFLLADCFFGQKLYSRALKWYMAGIEELRRLRSDADVLHAGSGQKHTPLSRRPVHRVAHCYLKLGLPYQTIRQLGSVPSSDRDVAYWKLLGLAAKKVNDRDSARRAASNICRLVPNSISSVMTLISCDAVAEAEKMVRNTFSNAEAIQLVQPYIVIARDKEYGRAGTLVDRYLLTHSSDASMHAFRGYIYIQQGKYSLGCSCFEKARTLDSSIIDYMDFYAIGLRAKHDDGKLANLAHELTELHEGHHHGRVAQAISDIALGNRDNAEATLARVLDQEPQHAVALLVKGFCLQASPDLHALRDAHHCLPSPLTCRALIAGLVSSASTGQGASSQQVHFAHAVALAHEAMQVYKGYDGICLAAYVFAHAPEKANEAVRLLNLILARDPGNVEATMSLVHCCVLERKYAEALDAMQKIRLPKHVGMSQAFVLCVNSLLHVLTHKYESAVNASRNALSLEINNRFAQDVNEIAEKRLEHKTAVAEVEDENIRQALLKYVSLLEMLTYISFNFVANDVGGTGEGHGEGIDEEEGFEGGMEAEDESVIVGLQSNSSVSTDRDNSREMDQSGALDWTS